MIRLSKAMTLMYLTEKPRNVFTSDTFIQGERISLRDNYTPITQMPLAEMRFGGHPIQLAEEVIALSASTDWRRQGRRPLMRGDVICRGEDPWVLLKRSEITVKIPANAVLPLRLWPRYAIAFLDGVTEELKELMH